MMSVCSGGPNGTASKKHIRGLSCVYPSTYGTTAPSGPWLPSEDASKSVYAIQYSPATMIKKTSKRKCGTGMYLK
jgi:hypothetical protein